MKFIFIFIFSLLIPFTVTLANIKTWTVPFGGRVISVEIPGITCLNPTGTAPVVLNSNIAGAIGAGFSAADRSQTGLQRTANTASNLYRAIPLYTLGYSPTGPVRQPKVGDWILGNQRLVPNISTCVIDGANVPFPVVETDVFGVSGNSSLR